MTEEQKRALEYALNRAFRMGKSYWADADIDSFSAWKRADKTKKDFKVFVQETLQSVTAQTVTGDCKTCEGNGRINCQPDEDGFTHPCDDCQPEANKNWNDGYEAAEHYAAQTVTDDEVQRSVEILQDMCLGGGIHTEECVAVETLIRAATTPKPCECDGDLRVKGLMENQNFLNKLVDHHAEQCDALVKALESVLVYETKDGVWLNFRPDINKRRGGAMIKIDGIEADVIKKWGEDAQKALATHRKNKGE